MISLVFTMGNEVYYFIQHAENDSKATMGKSVQWSYDGFVHFVNS